MLNYQRVHGQVGSIKDGTGKWGKKASAILTHTQVICRRIGLRTLQLQGSHVSNQQHQQLIACCCIKPFNNSSSCACTDLFAHSDCKCLKLDFPVDSVSENLHGYHPSLLPECLHLGKLLLINWEAGYFAVPFVFVQTIFHASCGQPCCALSRATKVLESWAGCPCRSPVTRSLRGWWVWYTQDWLIINIQNHPHISYIQRHP